MNYKISIALFALIALFPNSAAAQLHPAGTNVVDSSGTIYLIANNGSKRPYTSEGAFLSYGFNSWYKVVSASAEDLALDTAGFVDPREGTIICSDRGEDKGTCYAITSHSKRGFVSAEVFYQQGYNFNRVQYGDVSWLSAGDIIQTGQEPHVRGALVSINGTIYSVNQDQLLGIPDLATFNSWGFTFSEVLQANAADQQLPKTYLLDAYNPGDIRFLIKQ